MNKIICFFIIFTILLGITFLKRKNKFTEFIKLDYDLYIPSKDNIIDFEQKSINSHRICIYDDETSNVDLECIDAQKLFSVFDLPYQFKTEICIDDKCLTKEDLQVINGTKSIVIKSKDNETTASPYNNLCISENIDLKSHACGQTSNIVIKSLGKTLCNIYDYTREELIEELNILGDTVNIDNETTENLRQRLIQKHQETNPDAKKEIKFMIKPGINKEKLLQRNGVKSTPERPTDEDPNHHN